MTRKLSEIISDMRNIVKPYIAKQLKQLNFEHCGSTDKAEFETEFEMVLTLAEMVNNQVTPQEPKTGHWIDHDKHIECDKCKTWFLKDHLIRKTYCPNCGCCMVQPQESEGA